jgi:outer membrane protein assembly factor BamB
MSETDERTAVGEERWHFETGDQITESLAIGDGTVYAGSKDATLYAVDADSGREE